MKDFCDFCDFGKYKENFLESCPRKNSEEEPFYYSPFNSYCGYANLDGIEITNLVNEIIFTETGRKVRKNCLLKIVYAVVEAEETLKNKKTNPWPKPDKSILCSLFGVSKREYLSLKSKMREIYFKKILFQSNSSSNSFQKSKKYPTKQAN